MFADEGGDLTWLLLSTAIALAAGAISGWAAGASRRREAKEERIRQEVLRWANPVLNAVQALESRLKNVLEEQLHPALNQKHGGSERPLDPDWAVSYDYVMPTTLFVFADYFAWVRLLQESLSLELFDSQTARGEFSASIWSVSKTLSDWPGEAPESKGQDSQVFALQHR
jgi:hypothetical protein